MAEKINVSRRRWPRAGRMVLSARDAIRVFIRRSGAMGCCTCNARRAATSAQARVGQFSNSDGQVHSISDEINHVAGHQDVDFNTMQFA
jgi:hypothetical protein